MLPKKGRKLPKWEGVLAGRQVYAETIAQLLEREHGGTHRAVKQVMKLTGASERTVKHWLSGQHGPDTVFFLRLVTSSPVIRAFVIGLIESSQGAGDERYGVDQQLQHTSGTKVTLTLEVEAVSEHGFSNVDVDIVRGNAKQLKFKAESTSFE